MRGHNVETRQASNLPCFCIRSLYYDRHFFSLRFFKIGGKRKITASHLLSMFVMPDVIRLSLIPLAFCWWACGVGGLPLRRYSLRVRADYSRVPSVISTSLGSPQILICGESGGRSCFVDLARRYRPSQSPCRTRSPARGASNASVLSLSITRDIIPHTTKGSRYAPLPSIVISGANFSSLPDTPPPSSW